MEVGAVTMRNGYGWIWPAVAAAVVALLQTFWASSVTGEQTRLQHEIESLATRVDRVFIARAEFEKEVKRIDQRHEALESWVTRSRDTYLTKDAYFGPHNALISDIANLKERLETTRKEFGSSYTLNDKIKELQDAIKALQDKTYATKPNT